MSAKTALEEIGDKGRFVRSASSIRNWIGTEEFPAEADRYHLYISYACPWANRTLCVMLLKGLSHVIGLSVVHPTWQRTRPDDAKDEHCGWVFRDPKDAPVVPVSGFGAITCEDCIPDTLNHSVSIRDLYLLSDPEYAGKFTVPVLWDKKTKKVVNNESSEIVLMLNSEFNAFATNPKLDLYPKSIRTTIDEVNQWIYDDINNGVYKCGFAKSQEAYNEAVEKLFSSLEKVEAILESRRYIAGDVLTIADIRLFMTLVRFDEVYVVYFKCDRKTLREFPNIRNYCRDLFSRHEIAESINMRHIKAHYFTSHPTLNHYSIIPTGPRVLEDLKRSHDRDTKFPSKL